MASLSSLLSFQRFPTDNPWQDIVCDVVVNEVFDLIAGDSSEYEEKTLVLTDVPKKRARHHFGPESSKRTHFYSQYIVKADECINRTSTVSI